MSLLKVKDHDRFYKDTSSGAVINKNNSDYQQYVETRDRLLSEKERLDSIENDIHDIKSPSQSLRIKWPIKILLLIPMLESHMVLM